MWIFLVLIEYYSKKNPSEFSSWSGEKNAASLAHLGEFWVLWFNRRTLLGRIFNPGVSYQWIFVRPSGVLIELQANIRAPPSLLQRVDADVAVLTRSV